VGGAKLGFGWGREGRVGGRWAAKKESGCTIERRPGRDLAVALLRVVRERTFVLGYWDSCPGYLCWYRIYAYNQIHLLHEVVKQVHILKRLDSQTLSTLRLFFLRSCHDAALSSWSPLLISAVHLTHHQITSGATPLASLPFSNTQIR